MSRYCAKLENEALLHLQGPDARSFLQGQLTCDTRKLSAEATLPGAYCTVQGRVVCDFLLCELAEEHCVLRMRRDIRAASADVLAKYVVFSKARIEAEREDWQVAACWGPGARDLLQEVFHTVPSQQFGSCRGEGFALVQMDEAGRQYECYLQRGVADDRYTQLFAGALSASENDWRALQIEAGYARIETATAGEFIPQMLNYDLTGHISFKKGCYTGQEVVARMHYRGKPKRRLYRAYCPAGDLAGASLPTSGAPLFSGGRTQSVGHVVNIVTTSEGNLALLVTATSDGLENGLHLISADGPALRTDPANLHAAAGPDGG